MRAAHLERHYPINTKSGTVVSMTFSGFSRPIGIVLLVVGIVACTRGREYELRGQVLAVDASRQQITVKHEDIRGFMPGMTMPFRVQDRGEIEKREPGELIVATLVIAENEAYLKNVRHTGSAPLAEPAAAPVAYDVLEPGESVPEGAFVDQNGARRTMSDWKGKAVALTFIYTRCPLPDFCPLMDRHFLNVQRMVAAEAGLRDRIQLLSVSFDPAHDTPQVLDGHARQLGADTRSWSFLTGETADIDRFAARFGISIIRNGTTAEGIVHNLRTAVVDPDGKLVKVFGGNEWQPADLVATLRQAVERR
jgi:protein SCO1/2